MNVTIVFFATLKDRAGRDRLPLELEEPTTVGGLKQALAAQLPALAPALSIALVSINHEFALTDDALHEGDEVALFPPVSGGAPSDGAQPSDGQRPTIYKITNDELDLDALVASITLPTTGAACLFTGLVRGQTVRSGDGHSPHITTRLEYDAYIPMAEAKLQQVAEEIRQRWPAVEGIVLVQRIGTLPPGTPTVLIACSAGHRDTGVFEAARYGIDRLKEIVPVWKKEIGPDGAEWVEGHYRPGVDDRRPAE